ncbi:AIPR family protein [Brevibacillus laterosporus]|uniref:AIPR family protein n=1 Tax=Brevibacillus laterosporus TaxID=1465 RepID=UPI0018CD5596|nr:AIPR family protein [Brevibacillus laterosporus]MBG9789672.1 AIPR protein [Brevibacillus laterosporus]
MKETIQKLDFFKSFIEKVGNRSIAEGGYQTPFLSEMLIYMEKENDPTIFSTLYQSSQKKIQLNGYAYEEEQNSLDLYVVDYEQEISFDTLNQVTMSHLLEIANKAKRFITNVNFVLENVDRSRDDIHGIVKILKDESIYIEEVNIFILTNKFYQSNKPIQLDIPGIETVNVQVWDMDRIYQLVMAEQGVQDFYIDLEETYNQSIHMMYVPNEVVDDTTNSFECYIGFIPAELLARMYEDWGPRLVERNVRSFLQAKGGTNKGIRDTLKDPEQRKMFVAYNNGISTVARSGNIKKINDEINLYQITGLTGWQIVNGGQTTASIHQAYKNEYDLSGVYVQAKLTILKILADQENDQHVLEDEMVSKISEYANTQNKINKSDLLANTRFMSDIEKLSRSTWVPTKDGRKAERKWYFERARGQYMVDINRRKRGKEQNQFKKQFPKENVLTKVDLAKHYMSWEGFPHISSKGGEEAFKKFMEQNKKHWKYERDLNDEIIPLMEVTVEIYQGLIARSILNQYVSNIVSQMNLKGYRANVIYYTTAMFSYIYGKEIDLQQVWLEQGLTNKWDDIISTIATHTLNFLKESAEDQNVTQWAKKEICWELFKDECYKQLVSLV